MACRARLVAGIDKWPLALETYRLNNPDARTYESDLETRPPQKIAREVGTIELLLASPECTNHSLARGGADPDEKSQNTAFQVTRFAEALKPRWIVIENVVKMQQWRHYGKWLKKLKTLGYENCVQVVSRAATTLASPRAERDSSLSVIVKALRKLRFRKPYPKATVESINRFLEHPNDSIVAHVPQTFGTDEVLGIPRSDWR